MSAGELLLVGFEGKEAPGELLARIAAGRVGGVVLFARNLGAPVEIAALCRSLADAAPPGPPLILAIDQEGGRVQRIEDPLTVWPPMLRVGRLDDVAATEAVGEALGAELALLGFNVDFAPVLDVLTNPANPVIGDRAFGEQPEAVSRHALAFLRGLERAGVRGCGKHYPGHGDTHLDSHLALPRLDADLERLRAVELAPFAAAVVSGISMIMTAHVIFSALDDRPATMSRLWVAGVLRGELGFRGVVVSDDLDMKAIADHYTMAEVVGEALPAGVDAFLTCRDPATQLAVEEALERAAEHPTLGRYVAESRQRMHAFRSALRPVIVASPEALGRALPDAAHRALAARF